MSGNAPVPRPGSGEMFDRIAPRYDLLNRLLSLGIDRGWRRAAVAALRLPPRARVLDLATGTGDLALEVLRRHPDARVAGLDPARRMLAIGREKVRRRGLAGRIVLAPGVAETLPFRDGSLDGITIAFGIRNVPDRSAALREMARVLRPGARVAILELGEPRTGLLAPLARTWVRGVLPRVGGLLSRSDAYAYLADSMRAFPPPEAFAGLMEDAGLRVLEVRPLAFGVATLFVGTPREAGP